MRNRHIRAKLSVDIFSHRLYIGWAMLKPGQMPTSSTRIIKPRMITLTSSGAGGS